MKLLYVILSLFEMAGKFYVEFRKKQKQAKLDKENEKLKENPNAWFDDHFSDDVNRLPDVEKPRASESTPEQTDSGKGTPS